MSTYKLTYFDAKGLAEGIRMILSYMGKSFQDNRFSFGAGHNKEWESKKKEIKFGRLPILEIDGETLCQSTAICRFLAVEAGLSGDNARENVNIDMIAGSVKDLATEVARTWTIEDEDAKANLIATLKTEMVPKYLSIYEETASKNNGYLANGKLSWVDFWTIGYFETLEAILGPPLFDNYPYLKALKEKIEAIPNVKKWIDSRPDTLY